MKRVVLFPAIFIWSIIGPVIGVLLLTFFVDAWLPFFKEEVQWQVFVFIVAGFFLLLFSILPTHAISVVSGLLFGLFWGPVLALGTVFLALIFTYYLIDNLFDEKQLHSIRRYKKAHVVYEDLIKQSGFKMFWLISLIRLSPVMPFSVTNVILGAAKVKFLPYLAGSILGLFPRVILVAVAGASLQELDLSKGKDRGLFILGVVSTILMLFFIGKLVKNSLKKNREMEDISI